MYTGALRAASNRATWTFSIELTDPDTDLPINLTGALIEVAVREQRSAASLMTGSSTDSRVVISSPATLGVFTVTFSKNDMQALLEDHYDVGIRVTLASGTSFQLLKADLPVIDGVLDP